MNNYSSVRHVFFDIDNTITLNTLGYNDVGYFEYVLAGILCRMKGMNYSKALETTLMTAKNYPFHDPFLASEELGIPLKLYRNELAEFQNIFLHVFEDAVKLVKNLKKREYELYIQNS